MDLFVVNRPEEDSSVINEKANIARLLKRIEKRKRKRIERKQSKSVKTIINKTKETSKEKRERKLQTSFTNPVNAGETPILPTDTAADHSANLNKFNVTSTPNHLELEGFTILGSDKYDKKPKIKRVLPKWLSNPTVISVNLQDLQHKVSKMKCLDKDLRKKLKINGIKYFFPVQSEIIPWLVKSYQQSNIIIPRDICVSAPTGSGKTLAFALPVIQALKKYLITKIRALIILPTQDLAYQVFKTFYTYVQGTHLKVSLITGKCTFAAEQEELVTENEAFSYLSKVDILVCTAGRLVDHLKETKGFDLTHLKYLIIDEADRVLDNIQNDWLYHLEKHIYQNEFITQGFRMLNLCTLEKPRPPQKCLFSATLSQDPEKIQKLSLFQPKLFTSIVGTSENINTQINTDSFIGKYATPRELTEKYIKCSEDLKPLVLYQFIKQENLRKTVIFTHSMQNTHRLAILLRSLFKSTLKIQEVSSRLETKRRNKLIEDFSKGNVDMIICTDKLARGIDLVGVQCVISYSAPTFLKTYIHRAGRTARAGEYGLAVTLLNKADINKFFKLLQEVGKNNLEEIQMSEDGLELLGEEYKEALQTLKQSVVKEGKASLRKKKLAKRQVRKSFDKK